MVRAKFRCMEVAHRWDGSHGVELRPVTAKSKYTPDGCEENSAFWEATPSGEIRLSYKEGSPEFEPGAFYYVDMLLEPQEGKRAWTLDNLGQTPHSVDVTFGIRWTEADRPQSGSIKMTIQNREAWPAFIGKVGTEWAVQFTRTTT